MLQNLPKSVLLPVKYLIILYTLKKQQHGLLQSSVISNYNAPSNDRLNADSLKLEHT